MTKVYGHRGSRTRTPENTMCSFQLAAEEGAYGLEIDIRTTADGEIVISHDKSLKRCGGVDLLIGGATWAEIAKIPVHCPDLFGDRFKETAFVPRLEELFDWMRGNDLALNIEVKQQEDREYGYIERETLALAARYGLSDRIFYSSFDEYILVKLKELDPRVKTALLYSTALYNAGAHARALGCFAIHPNTRGAEQYEDMQKALALGMDCNVWTVNEPAEAIRLAQGGATGIITDDPAKILAALKG